MKKVIDLLGKRKVAISLHLDNLPQNIDEHIAERATELQEEEKQIEKALLILSNTKLENNERK